jgi:nucleoid DNA-binding protein
MSTKAATPGKALSKTEVTNLLAEQTGLPKKEVGAVLEGLANLIGHSLSKKGTGVFNMHGLAKFKVVRKPATKARKGINPITKQEMIFKAKPARNVVKILALKSLKDQV